jgi:hypothetical protein
MTPPFAVFTYLVTWCITLFTLLPVKGWSVRKKLLLNCILAAGVTLFIYLLLKSGLVPLRNVY